MTNYETKCGGKINVTHQGWSHLQAHPNVLEHLQEAISKIQLPAKPQKIEFEVDLGRIVGRQGIVETAAVDIDASTLFALRTNRKSPSRVAAAGVLGSETTRMVVIAKPSRIQGEYDLITSWVGILAKKEPWDPNITTLSEFNECLKFWSSTALVYQPEVMGPVLESSWEQVLFLADSPFSSVTS